MAASQTKKTNASENAQAYIWRTSFNALRWAVPAISLAKVRKMPTNGFTLQVNNVGELDEASTLSEVTTMSTNATDGLEDMNYAGEQHTITKKGKRVELTDQHIYDTLLDAVDDSKNLVVSSVIRKLNTDYWSAACGPEGLRWLRQDANTTAEVQGLSVSSASTTAGFTADGLAGYGTDWFKKAQIIATSGVNAGRTMEVATYTTATGAVTFTNALRVAFAVGDTFDICTVGNSASAVDEVLNTDKPVLADVLRAQSYCLDYGAGSAEMMSGGQRFDVAGMGKEITGELAQGIAFAPIALYHDIRGSLTGGDIAQAYTYTETGLKRFIRAEIKDVGGFLFVPVNHYVRQDVDANTFSRTSGAAWPILMQFMDSMETTQLFNAKGRNGVQMNAYRPARNTLSNHFASIRWVTEEWAYNVYFRRNALAGCALWCGTQSRT